MLGGLCTCDFASESGRVETPARIYYKTEHKQVCLRWCSWNGGVFPLLWGGRGSTSPTGLVWDRRERLGTQGRRRQGPQPPLGQPSGARAPCPHCVVAVIGGSVLCSRSWTLA